MIGSRKKSQIYQNCQLHMNLKSWILQIRKYERRHRSAFEQSSVISMYSESSFLASVQLFNHQRYFKRQNYGLITIHSWFSLMGEQDSLQSQWNQPPPNSFGTFFGKYLQIFMLKSMVHLSDGGAWLHSFPDINIGGTSVVTNDMKNLIWRGTDGSIFLGLILGSRNSPFLTQTISGTKLRELCHTKK